VYLSGLQYRCFCANPLWNLVCLFSVKAFLISSVWFLARAGTETDSHTSLIGCFSTYSPIFSAQHRAQRTPYFGVSIRTSPSPSFFLHKEQAVCTTVTCDCPRFLSTAASTLGCSRKQVSIKRLLDKPNCLHNTSIDLHNSSDSETVTFLSFACIIPQPYPSNTQVYACTCALRYVTAQTPKTDPKHLNRPPHTHTILDNQSRRNEE